jgi:serine/threonine protein kinase
MNARKTTREKFCLGCNCDNSDDHTCSAISVFVGKVSHAPIPLNIVIADRYKLLSLHAVGPSSTVWRAWDAKTEQELALKLIGTRPDIVWDEGHVAGLQRHARALLQLDHQNIAKLHDFGMDCLDVMRRPFLVTDFIKGTTLLEKVRDLGPQDLPFIIDVFIQACDALAYAHSKGFLHHNLKPSNIIIIRDRVKILDFGLGQIRHRNFKEGSYLIPNWLYASPENFSWENVDNRSDIYSMGCIIYECFTGVPPFKRLDLSIAHLFEAPKQAGLFRSNVEGASKIDAIVLKCMAKKPEDRFQSMEELRGALLELGVQVRTGLIASIRNLTELRQLRARARQIPELSAK